MLGNGEVKTKPWVNVFRGYAEHLPLIEPLIRRAFEKGGYPGQSVKRSIELLADVVKEGEESGHFLLLAVSAKDGVGYTAEGYAWVEAMEAGDLWIHQVYSGSDAVSDQLHEVLKKMAKESGLKRLVGFIWRGHDAVLAYERRWGAHIIGHVMALDLDKE
jgi:hypothetical protein